MKRILKILFYAIVCVLFIIVASVGVTQTALFRNWLKRTILSNVNTAINGELHLGKFTGSLFTGLTIDSLSLKVHGSEFVYAERVDIQYNPLTLWRKRVSLSDLTVHQPTIHLIKSKDGLWNFENLIREKGEGGGAFDWAIDISSLEIKNGKFAMVDSSMTRIDTIHTTDSLLTRKIDFSNLHLNELNLAIAGFIDSDTKDISLQHLSFISTTDSFHLKNLSGNFYIDKKKALVTDFDLETDSSHIQLSGSVNNVNLLGSISLALLKDKKIHLDLAAKKFSFDDLKRFLPELDFLNGTATLTTTLDGKFGDFDIKQLEVKTGHSDLKLTGAMKNLHKPDKLYLDVNFAESILQPEDMNALLPKFNIPDLSSLGKVKFKVLQYRGEPLNFTAKFDATTEHCGMISADAHLDITSPTLKYNGTVTAYQVNVSKITGNENLASSLNFSGTIRGSGTTLEDLNTTLKIQIDTSRFLNQFIEQSQLTVEASEKTINGFLALFSNPTQLYVNASLTRTTPNSVKYSIGASVVSLDISKFTGNVEHESDLTFKLSARGRGQNLDDLYGTLNLTLLPSVFRGQKLRQIDFQMSLEQQHTKNKALTINSDIADATVQGSFNIHDAISIIQSEWEAMGKAIQSKMFVSDSTQMEQEPSTGTAYSKPVPHFLAEEKSAAHGSMLDFNYKIKLKDFTPLSVILGSNFIGVRGDADGVVRGNRENLFFNGTINISDFYYADTTTNILLQSGHVKFQLDNITADSLLANLKSRIYADAESLYIGNTLFSDIKLRFDYRNYMPSLSGQATVDSQLTVEMGGSADISGDIYTISMDKFLMNYRGYQWENTDKVIAKYSRSGIEIEQCDFKRGSEQINLSGKINPEIENSLKLNVQNLRLSGMQNIFGKKGEWGVDGFLNLQADITGNYREPIINIDLAADSLTYSDIRLGTCVGKLHYANKNAQANVLYNIQTTTGEKQPSLTLSGMIPVDLSLASVGDRLIDSSMDVSIQTNNFPLAILNPLLQGVRDVRGNINSDVHITGTLGTPYYDGYVVVQDGQFLLEANNILYLFSSRMEPRGDTLRIVSLELKNDPSDKRDGIVTIAGDIELKQFQLNYFDLVAHGQLLALKESSKKFSKSVYGDLAIAFGDTGLRYSGNFENSRLMGTVLLTEGNMIFPPSESNPSYGVSRSNFLYSVIDDTSKALLDSTRATQVDMKALYTRNVASSQKKTRIQHSILDGLNYDLVIETQRDIQANMIFNSLTGEELLARLNGKIFLRKVGRQNLLFGDVNISEQSVFKFWYRKLDASGNLRFNGDLANPELNIKAKYEGFHTDTTHGATRNQRVVITLTITGTKEQPKISWDMTVDGEQQLGDIESDALSFILTGKFEKELTSGERQNMAVNFSDLGYSSVSSMLSGKLTDLLRNELGIIKSVEYQYSGGDILQEAQLNVSGDIGRAAIFRLGGRIFNDISSTNVSIEFPLGEIFQSRALRNLYLELERKTTSVKPNEERETSIYGAKLYYRIAF